MTAPDSAAGQGRPFEGDEIVEMVVRLPRAQLEAYREHHRLFLLRLQRDHDHVAMTGPVAAADEERARLVRLAALKHALNAGKAVTRATLAAGVARGRDDAPGPQR